MMRFMNLDAPSLQTELCPNWESGRQVDMAAFDQLPRTVRNFLNEQPSFYPIEDVLYEHVTAHGRDEDLTMVWLLEGIEMLYQLENRHHSS